MHAQTATAAIPKAIVQKAKTTTPAKPTSRLFNGKAKAEMKALSQPEPQPKAATAFDYNRIADRKTRAKFQAVAKSIKGNITTEARNLLDNGRRLISVKEDLAHGLGKSGSPGSSVGPTTRR